MFLVDTVAGPHHLRQGDQAAARRAPALRANGSRRTDHASTSCPSPRACIASNPETLLRRQRAFGYTEEDLRIMLRPWPPTGEEPIGSMGTDTPLACLSDRPQPLFNYFKQLFAQVTNPPIDPIREEMVMSLTSYIGTERNILDEKPENCHTLKLPHPILTNRDLEKLRRVSIGRSAGHHAARAVPRAEGEGGLKRALDELCRARLARGPVRLHAADPLRSRRRSPTTRPFPACWPGRGAQPAGPRRDAHPGRPHHRERASRAR